MTTPDADGAFERVERLGHLVMSAAVAYLPDVQLWEPRVTIERDDGGALPFVVPCGPECYRKQADEALNAGWAAGRQWLDGGRIPWKAR